MKTPRDMTRIYETILERFGEPIGKADDAGEGVADERHGKGKKGEEMGNRGFGAAFCEGCEAMLVLEADVCQKCGMMHAEMDENERGAAPFNRMAMGAPEHVGEKKRPVNPNYTPHAMPKKNISVDWNGFDEADEMDEMDEMKLGISDRTTGLPDRRDDYVGEPEEYGMKMEPRHSVVEPGVLRTPALKRRKTDEGGPMYHKPGKDEMPTDMDENQPLKDKRGGSKGNFEKGMDEAPGALKPKNRTKPEEMDEATPPKGEKVVKALKKQKDVKNPWAVAWSMKNKGEF